MNANALWFASRKVTMLMIELSGGCQDWLNQGHAYKICSLDSGVVLSHRHVVGSLGKDQARSFPNEPTTTKRTR